MNGVRNLSALFDTVKAPIGALLDTGNILQSGDSVEKYIKAFGPLIRHVHIKDMLIRKKPPIFPDRYWSKVGNTKGMVRQTVVGMGDIDFIRVLKMLKALNYNGWYSLEYDTPEAFDIYYPRSMENFAAMHAEVFGADQK
jgi:sugar phosphate isomerase/epimerase